MLFREIDLMKPLCMELVQGKKDEKQASRGCLEY